MVSIKMDSPKTGLTETNAILLRNDEAEELYDALNQMMTAVRAVKVNENNINGQS